MTHGSNGSSGDSMYPSLFRSSEKISSDAQATFLRARAAEYTSLVLAAGAGMLPNDSVHHAGPLSAITFFLIALVLRASRTGDRAERTWYDARAASESIKSSSWQYAVAGEAFRIDEEDADKRYINTLRSILKRLEHLDIAAEPGQSAVTSDMRALRASALDLRRKRYVTERVDDQTRWYRDKAAFNKMRAKYWFIALVVTESLAVLLGLLRLLDVFDIDLLGLLAAGAAAIAAWQQTKNYTALAEAYAVTSHEIVMVRESFSTAIDEASFSQVVHDAEAAFSREHTMFISRRQGPR